MEWSAEKYTISFLLIEAEGGRIIFYYLKLKLGNSITVEYIRINEL